MKHRQNGTVPGQPNGNGLYRMGLWAFANAPSILAGVGLISLEKCSKDEWIVLLYYFMNRPQPTQTDSHGALQVFARDFGRTPGSIDASMRNIKSYVADAGFPHGAETMRRVVDRYQNRAALLRSDARAALARINPRATLP